MADGTGGEELNNMVVPDDSVVIDIEAAMNVRRRQFQQLTGTHNPSPAMCMYKVPHSLIGITPKATDPEKISIGPYHRGKAQLSDFDKYKWRSLENLLSRTNKDLRGFVEAAFEMEESARSCYDDTIASMLSSEFVEMMVLDGCFIIELFRPGGSNGFSTPAGLIPVITGDLLKLENQLPFFVLQKLFELSSTPGVEEDPLALLALKFFHVSFPRPTEEVLSRSTQLPEVKHLLHLLHASSTADFPRAPSLTRPQMFMRELRLHPFQSIGFLFAICFFFFLIPEFYMTILITTLVVSTVFLFIRRLRHRFGPHQEYRPSPESIPCTTKLRKSGFTFKPLRAESLLIIHYKDQVLQIPAISISDLTATVFVNCIALEQCSVALEQGSDQNPTTPDSKFTTYIAFMSCLINSRKDVACLSSDGIITSSFSYNDHDVAALFNKLGEKVYFDKKDCYLSRQFKDMEAFYNSPQASFIRTYFSSPWSFISVVSACLLISLSVGQTVISILTYVHSKS